MKELYGTSQQHAASGERQFDGRDKSDRTRAAAQFLPTAELVKTGNGFDQLQPNESLVTVVVPSYAHEEFVAQALQSIIGQSYRHIEVILIDDESPDHTFERASAVLAGSERPYCAIRTAHAGLDANLNAGIMLGYGRWLAMLASDDYFSPDCIERLFAAGRRERADVVVGPVDEVTRDGEFKASRNDAVARYRALSGDALRRALLMEHGSLMVQGMLIGRHVFSRVGLFTPELVASDFDFLIRMASHQVRFAFVSEVATYHRQTRTRLSAQHIRASVESHIGIAKRHARSATEYRAATSKVLCDGALNALHFGHLLVAGGLLAASLVKSPIGTCKTLASRLAGKLRA